MDDGAAAEIADRRADRPAALDAMGLGARPGSSAALAAGAGAGAPAGADLGSPPMLEAAALGRQSGETDPPGS
jgi:hypothetical protein